MLEWLGKLGESAISTIGNFVGANQARIANERAAAKNLAVQKDFAKHGIRWKVEDAKRAGIHPLAALGASTHSPSPIYAGDTSVANAFSQSGQDIGRAISSTSTSDERALQKLQIASAKAALDGQIIDNQIRASQLRKINQTGPNFPGGSSFMQGQGNSSIQDVPLERVKGARGAGHQEPGAITGVGYEQTSTGVVPVPSKDVKERIEDNIAHELRHFFRNNLLPYFGDTGSRPARGWKWHWSGEWQRSTGNKRVYGPGY